MTECHIAAELEKKSESLVVVP